MLANERASVFPIILALGGRAHGDLYRASESPGERERRGLRRFTIGVSEDDLRVIAEHGYEGLARFKNLWRD